MGKKRATYHNGRGGTRHNFREYDYSEDDHVDSDLVKDNRYWINSDLAARYYPLDQQDPNFRYYDYEKAVFAGIASNALAYANEKHIEARHRKRVKTIDQWYTSKKYGVRETLYEIGNVGDHADADLLEKCYREFREWENKEYGGYVLYLDAALQVDEPGSGDHIHERKLFLSRDDQGNLIPDAARFFADHNIQRPKPNKKEDRYNHPMITYSAMCRKKFQEICIANGIDLETTPRKKSQSGKTLEKLKYETAKAEETLDALEQKAKAQESEIAEREDIISKKEQEAKERERESFGKQEKANAIYADVTQREHSVSKREEKAMEREKVVTDQEKQLEAIYGKVGNDLFAARQSLMDESDEDYDRDFHSVEELAKDIEEKKAGWADRVDAAYEIMQEAEAGAMAAMKKREKEERELEERQQELEEKQKELYRIDLEIQSLHNQIAMDSQLEQMRIFCAYLFSNNDKKNRPIKKIFDAMLKAEGLQYMRKTQAALDKIGELENEKKEIEERKKLLPKRTEYQKGTKAGNVRINKAQKSDRQMGG